MPPVTEDELRRLRLKYQAAYHAYKSCMIALTLAGDQPAQELLDQKDHALDDLAEARRAYSDALAQTSFGPDDPSVH